MKVISMPFYASLKPEQDLERVQKGKFPALKSKAEFYCAKYNVTSGSKEGIRPIEKSIHTPYIQRNDLTGRHAAVCGRQQ